MMSVCRLRQEKWLTDPLFPDAVLRVRILILTTEIDPKFFFNLSDFVSGSGYAVVVPDPYTETWHIVQRRRLNTAMTKEQLHHMGELCYCYSLNLKWKHVCRY